MKYLSILIIFTAACSTPAVQDVDEIKKRANKRTIDYRGHGHQYNNGHIQHYRHGHGHGGLGYHND